MNRLDEIARRSEIRKTWWQEIAPDWSRCRYCGAFDIKKPVFTHERGCLVIEAIEKTEDDIDWIVEALRHIAMSGK